MDKVKALVANQDEAVTFFCGGSRNFAKFIDLFDGVFVLEVDLDTSHRRLDERPDSGWRRTAMNGNSVRIASDKEVRRTLCRRNASVARVVDEIEFNQSEADK